MGKVLVTYKEKYEEMRARYTDSLIHDDMWSKRCHDLLAENKRLREAFRKYGWHMVDCRKGESSGIVYPPDKSVHPEIMSCTCGFEKALERSE